MLKLSIYDYESSFLSSPPGPAVFPIVLKRLYIDSRYRDSRNIQ